MRSKTIFVNVLGAAVVLAVLCSSASAVVVDTVMTYDARTSLNSVANPDTVLEIVAGGHIIVNDRTDHDGPLSVLLNGGDLTVNDPDNDGYKLPDNATGLPCYIGILDGTFTANVIESFGSIRLASIEIGADGTMIVQSGYLADFSGQSDRDKRYNVAWLIDDDAIYASEGLDLVVVELGGGGVQVTAVPVPGRDPYPTDEATGVSPICPKVVLHWTADYAPLTDGHHVYFSTVFDDVNDSVEDANQGIQDSNEFPESPAAGLDLEYGMTYYWKINEYNVPDAEWVEGDVWQFTTEAHQIPNAWITEVTADSSDPDKGPEKTLNLPENEDLHSNNSADMWRSTVGAGAWIKYKFDRVYKLREMWVWNYNGDELTHYGPNEVTIEYSVDGSEPYDTLGTYELGEGTGLNDYAHDSNDTFNNEIDLNVAAQYVRITANSTFGGAKAGLSEVRFFYTPMRAATLVSPEDEEKKVARNVPLVWQKPFTADITTHKVYISTEFSDVNNRTVDPCDVTAVEGLCDAQASYNPPSLEYFETYYWTVDEYYASETHKTWESDQVWSFTVTADLNEVVDTNMLLWLELDGDVNDSSGYRHHGTAIGAPNYVDGWVQTGTVEGMEFHGNPDYVNIDGWKGVSGPNAVSICLWINKTTNEDCSLVTWGTNSNGQRMGFRLDNEVLRFEFGGGNVIANTWVNDGEWHHVSMTVPSNGTLGDVILYVDGVDDMGVANNPANLFNLGSDTDVSIARRATRDDRYYVGKMDDIRIYDYALSEAEILKIIRGDLALAYDPNPGHGETDVDANPTLSWIAGDFVQALDEHDVYFGETFDEVNDANSTVHPNVTYQNSDVNSFDPVGPLDLGKTYYWRVDEINDTNGASPWKGNVWSFTVTDHIVVDDMESYGDSKTPGPGGAIFFVWRDGWTLSTEDNFPPGFLTNGTGASIGHWDFPYAEETIVNGGAQSMPYLYDNDGTVHGGNDPENPANPDNPQEHYSKAEAQIADLPSGIDPNWLTGGAKALSLSFHGDVDNDIEPMWVELTDTGSGKAKVKYGPPYLAEDVIDINEASWHEWNIDLQDFNDGGVDLTDVNSIAIIIGTVGGGADGTGTVYIDDIRLYATRCVLEKRDPDFAKVDYVGDECVVDAEELDLMFGDWLETDYGYPGQLLVHWEFDNGSGPTALDSGDDGFRVGDINNADWHSPGYNSDYCLDFNNGAFVIDNDANTYMDGWSGLTVALWVKSNYINTDAGFIIFGDSFGQDRSNIRYDTEGGESGRDDVIKFGVNTTEGRHEVESSAGVQTEEWQHVAMVWTTGEMLKLYIGTVPDPCLYEEDHLSKGGTLTGYDSVMVGKGSKDEGATEGWDGLIDDVRIYNFALTADEVATIFAGGTVAPRDAYYPLLSPANAYPKVGDEGVYNPANLDIVNFKDYAVLAERWLDKDYFPPE